MRSSALSGFYRLSVAARRSRLRELGVADEASLRALSGEGGLDVDQADHMIENAIGVYGLPLGVATHFLVDGCDRLAPMAIEEPSVVAAASHGAKLLRGGGGVRTQVGPPWMIGQVQLLEVEAPERAEQRILAAREKLLAGLLREDSALVAAGGGPREIEVRHLPAHGANDPLGPMLVVHVIVDVREAMGANVVNTICERLAPRLTDLVGGRARLRILSNLADRRAVVAEGSVPIEALGDDDVASGIVEASVFAERDPYRAATHNKGILNGIDAVLIACGQDWRAVEAGAHAFAAREGQYSPLATWRVHGRELRGRLELPLPVGTVGGVLRVHPAARAALALAGVAKSADLAGLAAAVGLAQNLSALRALAAEGIQQGHMRLHARSLAVAAGARGDEVEAVAERLAEREGFDPESAAEELLALREERDRG